MKMNTHFIRMPNWFWSPKNTYTLSWIRFFINETEYNNREIEARLYTHELITCNPKKTPLIFYFIECENRFFGSTQTFFYKKSIQLNHEFLADEKVVKSYNNVPFYQTLLLSKTNENNFYLASNLNYLITKKINYDD
jgi:hypothetical protein